MSLSYPSCFGQAEVFDPLRRKCQGCIDHQACRLNASAGQVPGCFGTLDPKDPTSCHVCAWHHACAVTNVHNQKKEDAMYVARPGTLILNPELIGPGPGGDPRSPIDLSSMSESDVEAAIKKHTKINDRIEQRHAAMLAADLASVQGTSDGSSADYYVLPEGATQLQELISFRNMNGQDAEMFRALYRKGRCSHSSKLREAKKVLFYAQAEVDRLLKYGENA